MFGSGVHEIKIGRTHFDVYASPTFHTPGGTIHEDLLYVTRMPVKMLPTFMKFKSCWQQPLPSAQNLYSNNRNRMLVILTVLKKKQSAYYVLQDVSGTPLAPEPISYVETYRHTKTFPL